MRLHDDELPVDVPLVRRLLQESFPEHADLPVRPLDTSGSSNRLFAVGDDLLARLPRQAGGSASIRTEHRWAPHLAAALPVRVPDVVGVGRPGHGYPEHWALTGWLEGVSPDPPWSSGRHGPGLAHDLADLISALADVEVTPEAGADASLTSYRVGELTALDEDFHEALRQCRGLSGLGLDLDRADAVWRRALAAEPDADRRTGWVHADLLAENLLLRGGRLSALLDLGGLAIGRPTVDLVVGWEVLDAAGRMTFRDALGVDDATWLVSRGWALLIAMITFPYYGARMPRRCAARRQMAAAALDGA